MNEQTLRFIKLDPRAVLPAAAHPGDAGADLCAIEGCELAPGARARVATGIAVAVPEGCAGLILPRSGLAHRHGITLTNAPGLIDSGYRGELQVLLLNTHREETFQVEPGERIAQFMLVPFIAPEWQEVESFESTSRGADGFGSTGS